MHHKSRIGILGGTFNPIHIGHLILGQEAVEALELETLLFVPSATPPHKDRAKVAPAAHRLAMVAAAIEDNPRFELSDIEIARGGVSYAVDTVSALHQKEPDADLYFIIGSDSLPELHLWKDIHSLMRLCRFVTFERPGSELESISVESMQLDMRAARKLLQNVIKARLIQISSSEIRHRTAEGLSIKYLVPSAVEIYVAEHGLYLG